ncbi:MAG: DUF3649 domain-containing protein [Alloalcanivorax xenomutans]
MSQLKNATRLSVASRVIAAGLGGYALSAAATAALSLGLPMPRVDAVITASVLSFLIYSAAVIWAFACATTARAWAGIAIPALLCGALVWLLGPAS